MLKKYFIVMDNTPVEQGNANNDVGIAVCKGHTKHIEPILPNDSVDEGSLLYIIIAGSLIGFALIMFALSCVCKKRNRNRGDSIHTGLRLYDENENDENHKIKKFINWDVLKSSNYFYIPTKILM